MKGFHNATYSSEDTFCHKSLPHALSLPLRWHVTLAKAKLAVSIDLDRDFWNNNDSSSVQQRWSSYPPKEFVLNISPYAPYGDPRLSLK
ncbi:hypothetical protein DPX16_3000 [Anabarilius grahami]|uniref:Uncharacterized protein n=1 Tax=Anabarilius grahami TaxID=495550 RepID=A0A3N0XIS1_ANAGA|nr:hypothetical protein DPX16_3000 [Anabarilius grahami]